MKRQNFKPLKNGHKNVVAEAETFLSLFLIAKNGMSQVLQLPT